jgi:hypothetical protein
MRILIFLSLACFSSLAFAKAPNSPAPVCDAINKAECLDGPKYTQVPPQGFPAPSKPGQTDCVACARAMAHTRTPLVQETYINRDTLVPAVPGMSESVPGR